MDKIDELIEKHQRENGSIIGLLQDVQQTFRYLPEEVLEEISERLDVPLSKLYALGTFYNSFRFDPVNEQIEDDDAAHALLKREYRDHWATPRGV